MSQDLQKYVRTPMTNSDLRTYMNTELAKIQQATDTFFQMLGDLNMLAGAQEGQFQVTVFGATTAGVATYTLNDFRYLKIGKFVFIIGIVLWSAHTGTGNIQIGNLPFPIGALTVSNLAVAGNGDVQPGDIALAFTGSTSLAMATSTLGGRALTGAAGSARIMGFYYAAS
jgi:hypothetical protein